MFDNEALMSACRRGSVNTLIIIMLCLSWAAILCLWAYKQSENPAETVDVSRPPDTSQTPRISGPAQEGDPWSIPDLDMAFGYVAPGGFLMGSNDGSDSEKPVHRVRITQGYWMGKYEVTQQQYQSIMGNNPSEFKGTSNPVEQVSWNDCVSFCRKLTEQERRAGRLPEGYEYRLPTEAEWEYAARGASRYS